MIAPNKTFAGTYPFAPHFSEVNGFRMHYVDEGRGEPILLLHGEPTWSYLFRQVIPRLASQHRVIAPDNMGFGKSETPQDRAYSPAEHVDNLEALILDLNLRNVTLVLHDWGGVIGGGVALRHPERIARVVVTNSLLALGLPLESELVPQGFAEAPYFRWIGRLYQEGKLEMVLSEFGQIATSVMLMVGLERTQNITSTWIQAYSEPFATPEEAIGAVRLPLSIASGASIFEPPQPDAVAALRRKPAIMIEGMRDKGLIPEYFIPCFEAAFPNAPVYRLEQAGHYLYEDEPDTVAALIEQFILLNPIPN